MVRSLFCTAASAADIALIAIVYRAPTQTQKESAGPVKN